MEVLLQGFTPILGNQFPLKLYLEQYLTVEQSYKGILYTPILVIFSYYKYPLLIPVLNITSDTIKYTLALLENLLVPLLNVSSLSYIKETSILSPENL